MAKTIYVYTGKCVTRSDSMLSPITLEQLWEKIKNPDPALLTAINRLRTLQTINLSAYREEKRLLPFFTCGSFSPPVRNSKNFGSISCFVLDIDHLSEKELSVEDVKKQIRNDVRVAMAFASPGNDGLKIIVTLENPCYDKALFSLFYRRFALSFSKQYDLQQVVDKKTCDVTRACFFSYDPNAYFNPTPQPVDLQEWIQTDKELSLNELIFQTKEIEVASKQDNGKVTIDQSGPDADTLALIRKKLNPSSRVQTEKNVFVPQALHPVTDEISRRVEEFNMVLTEVRNIHYGRKLKFVAGNMWAELNIFYGKKGFSVVCTPKRGSNQELAELARDMVWQILAEMEMSNFSAF